MNQEWTNLLKTIVLEYQKTGQPVRRNKLLRDLMPDTYPQRYSRNGKKLQPPLYFDNHLRSLINRDMITYLKSRSSNAKEDTSRTITSLITPTAEGIAYISVLPKPAPTPAPGRLDHALQVGQQAIPLAQEISRRDLDTKNQEIATLKTINAEQAEEIKSLKRKLAKLAAAVSMDDLLSMI